MSELLKPSGFPESLDQCVERARETLETNDPELVAEFDRTVVSGLAAAALADNVVAAKYLREAYQAAANLVRRVDVALALHIEKLLANMNGVSTVGSVGQAGLREEIAAALATQLPTMAPAPRDSEPGKGVGNGPNFEA